MVTSEVKRLNPYWSARPCPKVEARRAETRGVPLDPPGNRRDRYMPIVPSLSRSWRDWDLGYRIRLTDIGLSNHPPPMAGDDLILYNSHNV